ncbi:hypothetical protein F5B17DRAFT_389928 [Nemania serpens]|nr:hypothetical protein F5B17DRAFT_389928 [Nemania serpens]
MPMTVIERGLFRHIQNLAIIYNVITLHAPAMAAGLIHYGDTHTVVDIANTPRLRQFHHFYVTDSRRRREKNIRLLEMLMRPDGRLQYEQCTANHLRNMWLLSWFQMALYHEKMKFSIDMRFVPRGEWWYDWKWVIDGKKKSRGPGFHEYYVVRNEYADELLKQFPEFRVMVMFRICGAPVCNKEPEISD